MLGALRIIVCATTLGDNAMVAQSSTAEQSMLDALHILPAAADMALQQRRFAHLSASAAKPHQPWVYNAQCCKASQAVGVYSESMA